MACFEEYLKRFTSCCDIGQSHPLLSHLKPQKEIRESPPTVSMKVALKEQA